MCNKSPDRTYRVTSGATTGFGVNLGLTPNTPYPSGTPPRKVCFIHVNILGESLSGSTFQEIPFVMFRVTLTEEVPPDVLGNLYLDFIAFTPGNA